MHYQYFLFSILYEVPNGAFVHAPQHLEVVLRDWVALKP